MSDHKTNFKCKHKKKFVFEINYISNASTKCNNNNLNNNYRF